ncbi:MAG: hypothetical protein JW809_11880 [Pirellulales bacterium]|nr:hypothetical protein [Pirellulales bacterium]
MPSEPLIQPRFLFRFSAPCRYRDPLWTPRGAPLGEDYRLPSFVELDQRAAGPDVRAAWSEAGLVFRAIVTGKKQAVWCRAGRPEESDGLQVWIDTRNVQNVHRAGRFCHRLFYLPGGQGRDYLSPSAGVLPINRARQPHGPIQPETLEVRSRHHPDGYELEALVPAAALTGFDPAEHAALGFTYALVDRERGETTFGPGRPLPYQEDPSLWATLELVRD